MWWPKTYSTNNAPADLVDLASSTCAAGNSSTYLVSGTGDHFVLTFGVGP
jgi:hypothetical protein